MLETHTNLYEGIDSKYRIFVQPSPLSSLKTLTAQYLGEASASNPKAHRVIIQRAF